jgi:hypothetical protein
MIQRTDFFQAEVNECKHLAAHSKDQNDRDFWLKMAQRWQGLLEGRQSDPPAPQRVEKIVFQRRRRFHLEKGIAPLNARQLGNVRRNPAHASLRVSPVEMKLR